MSNCDSEEETEVNIWSWTPAFNPNASTLFRTKSEASLNFFVYDDLVSKQRLEKIIRNYGGSVCCDIVETYSIILVNENFKPPQHWGPCFSRNFIKDSIEIFELLELSNYLIPACVTPQCEGSLSNALFNERFKFRPAPIPTSYSKVMGINQTIENPSDDNLTETPPDDNRIENNCDDSIIENPPDDNRIKNNCDENIIETPPADNRIENPPDDSIIENPPDDSIIENVDIDKAIKNPDGNTMVENVLDSEALSDPSDYKMTNKPRKLTLKYKDKCAQTIYGYFSKCYTEFLVLEHVDNSVRSKELDMGIVGNNCLTLPREHGADSEAKVQRKSNSTSVSGSSDNFQDAVEEVIPQNKNVLGTSDSFISLSDDDRGIPSKEEGQLHENVHNSSFSTNSITDNEMLRPNKDLACASGSDILPQVNDEGNEADQIIEAIPKSVLKRDSLPSVIVTPPQDAIKETGLRSVMLEKTTQRDDNIIPSTVGIDNLISNGKRQVSSTKNQVFINKRDTSPSLSSQSKRFKLNHSSLVPGDSVNRGVLETVVPTASKSNVRTTSEPTDIGVGDFQVAGPSRENRFHEPTLLVPFFGVKKGKVKRSVLTPTDLINQDEPQAHSTPQCTGQQEHENNLCPSETSEEDSDDRLPDLKNWPNVKKYSQPDKHTRMKYSRKEKADIIKYIVAKSAYGRLSSNALYREMEARNVCPQRTYQSMKNHFLKTLLNELDTFDFLSDDVKRKLRGEVW